VQAGALVLALVAPPLRKVDEARQEAGERLAGAGRRDEKGRAALLCSVEQRELVRGLQLCLRKTVERPPRKHGNIPL